MKLTRFLLGLLLAVACCNNARACPMCKDTIANTAVTTSDGATSGGAAHPPSLFERGALPAGFNNATYVMLLGIFGTLGLVGYNLYRATRPARPAKRGFPVLPKDQQK